jgi:predicted PurR-regulated permease PerM
VRCPGALVANIASMMNDSAEHVETDDTKGKDHAFLHRVALVDGVAVLFLFVLAGIWYAANALLLIFSCVLFAILLYEVSLVVQGRFKVHRSIALPIVVATPLLIIGIGGWLMAPQISKQAARLSEVVPSSIAQLREALLHYDLPKWMVNSLPPNEKLSATIANMVPRAGLFFSGVMGALGNVLIILFVGIYFAAQPGVYINGMVTLVPHRKRERAREVLDEIGRTLAKWLVGKSASMLLVGLLTSVGLSLLGVPLALILGIIAGLLDFIPYLGPLMAGVPAVLIAFSDSPALALYTMMLFAGVQLVLYVQDVLGDKVKVPSEAQSKDG